MLRNADPSKLYEEAIRYEPGTTISDTGALIAYSGEKTGAAIAHFWALTRAIKANENAPA